MRPLRFALLALAAASTLAGAQQFTKPGPIALKAPVTLDTTGMFLAAFASVGEDVFIGGQPTPKALRELKARGVTTVVNLRTPEEMKNSVKFDEVALIKELGMNYVFLPGRGTGTEYPYTPDQVAKFADAVAHANGKVLLHCTVAWRASHMWAAYLIEKRGIAEEQALANARAINLMDEHRMSGDGTQPVEDYLGRKLKTIGRPAKPEAEGLRPKAEGTALFKTVSNVTPRQQGAPPVQNGALPFVSPDGKWITFTANRAGGMRNELYVIGADGTGEKQLTTGGGSSGKWLSATQIYFSEPMMRRPSATDTTTILTISPSGGAASTLMKVVGRVGTFTPDGKSLVAGTGQMPNMKMTRIPRDGGAPADLTDGSLPAFDPAYSKDGKRIAYAQMNAIPTQGTRPELQIWVMNADGSGKKQLSHFNVDVDGNAQWPSWSPDGKWIAVQSGAYSQKREDNTAHIWLINAETGEMKKLAPHDKPYLDETPSFFPDGKRIAFQSDRTGRMEIWVMNIDGTGARQVTR